jgi:hypothetical protein
MVNKSLDQLATCESACASQEVAEFHRFQKLSQDLVALNDKICRLRPVAQPWGWLERAGKKRLLQSIQRWRGK